MRQRATRQRRRTPQPQKLRPYVISHFDTGASAQQWGVVGWSAGGTCAVDLGVTHPELFGTFEDIQGDLSPNAGDTQQTIASLFGGNPQAWAAFDPTTVLAGHAPYPDSAGWFADAPPGNQPTSGNPSTDHRAATAPDARAGLGGRRDPAPTSMQGQQATTGRAAFHTHVQALESVIEAAQPDAQDT